MGEGQRRWHANIVVGMGLRGDVEGLTRQGNARPIPNANPPPPFPDQRGFPVSYMGITAWQGREQL